MNLYQEILLIAGIGVALIYFILIFFLKWGWDRTKEILIINEANSSFISVVVAARNEERHILRLLQLLISQDFQPSNFEIIIVDDWSEDKTFENAVDFSVRHPQYQIRVYTLSAGTVAMQGKKQALQMGYHVANGDIIVTTDADCMVPEKWLKTIAGWFEGKSAVMALMPVMYTTSGGLLHQWQSIELCSLMGAAGGSANCGIPVLSNGANLAFRKSVLEKLDVDYLNTKFSSGDDVFLLLAARQCFKGRILFLKSKDVIVKTDAAVSLRQFINQRLRWVSKNKAYKDFYIISFGLVVWLMQFFVLTLLVAGLWNQKLMIVGISIFVLKNIIDFIFLRSVIYFFKLKIPILYWGFYQFFYMIYVLGITFSSFFARFTWKGRRYKH